MLDLSEIERLLVDHTYELLRHLHQREYKSFLLTYSALEIVLLQNMSQFISEQGLSHQSAHAHLHFMELGIIFKLYLTISTCEWVLVVHVESGRLLDPKSKFLKDGYLVEL